MANSVRAIPLKKLVPHPDNPNRQSKANFAKLVRNIKRTGRYEPVIVRRCPQRYLRLYESGGADVADWIWSGICEKDNKSGGEFFQIINGYHRCRALAKLGYEEIDAIVWEVDDEQVDILLATLNRLVGSDELAKKVKLLGRLSKRMQADELSRLLPQTAKQIQRLCNLKRPRISGKKQAESFARAMVFFLSGEQRQIIEEALSAAGNKSNKSKAERNASALVRIAEYFLNNSTKILESSDDDEDKKIK